MLDDDLAGGDEVVDQLAEVDQIADRVAIVHHGRTALTGALDDLRTAVRRRARPDR